MNERSALPFPERVKAESSGFGMLSAEFVESQKRKELGYWLQVSKKLARPITDKEIRALNI